MAVSKLSSWNRCAASLKRAEKSSSRAWHSLNARSVSLS
jgi:hypothetical protein